METKIEGKPAFGYIHVDLEPGEKFITEADAMASMDSDLDMKATMNGNFFQAVGKGLLGGESFFIMEFSNNTSSTKRLTVTQGTPGDVIMRELNGESYCLQPGAFMCCEPTVNLGVKWAGFLSWWGGEGLFKLQVSGKGKVFFGAYGALVEKEIEGEYIVDTSHLVGYEPQMKLKQQLSGGIFSSLFSGEGFVTRVKGSGKIIIQTRSLGGFAGWINRYL